MRLLRFKTTHATQPNLPSAASQRLHHGAECRYRSLRTDEGALTGESETVLKQLEPVAEEARIQDKKNMVFSGTTVSNGVAVGVVAATGMRTEIGKIQANVQVRIA